jgi:hypothetical protein
VEPVHSSRRRDQRFTAAEQFVIDLADFVEHLLHLGISGHTLTCLVDLVRGFKQERLHLAFGEAAAEIKEWAVLRTAGVAVAIGFATFEESLDQGGVQYLGREFKGA